MGLIDRLRGADGPAASDGRGRSDLERRLLTELRERAGAGGPAGRIRLRLRFTGTVQGVGFRWTNQRIARERGETGWVTNLDDGSVEMELQGSPDDITAHLRALHASYDRGGFRVCLTERLDIAPRASDVDFDVRL